MRAIVYKLLKEKAKKENLLDYDLNDPDRAEVVWQSYSMNRKTRTIQAWMLEYCLLLGSTKVVLSF